MPAEERDFRTVSEFVEQQVVADEDRAFHRGGRDEGGFADEGADQERNGDKQKCTPQDAAVARDLWPTDQLRSVKGAETTLFESENEWQVAAMLMPSLPRNNQKFCLCGHESTMYPNIYRKR